MCFDDSNNLGSIDFDLIMSFTASIIYNWCTWIRLQSINVTVYSEFLFLFILCMWEVLHTNRASLWENLWEYLMTISPQNQLISSLMLNLQYICPVLTILMWDKKKVCVCVYACITTIRKIIFHKWLVNEGISQR